MILIENVATLRDDDGFPVPVGNLYCVWPEHHTFIREGLSEQKQQAYLTWAATKRAEFADDVQREIRRVDVLQRKEDVQVQAELEKKKQRQKTRRAELRALKRKREEEN